MTTPEQNLWREVLLVTVQDALSGCTSSGAPKTARLKATQEARRYLTDANPDFEMVCTMADLDPVAVREAMIKRLLDAPSPEGLGATKRQAPREQHSGKLITFNGEALRASAWAKRIGVSTQTIHARLNWGWSVERTVTTPPKSRRRGVVLDFGEAQGTGGGTA
ncbi:MAG: hypothetical protein ABJG14_11090 [Sulfitobacter sp.]|uniref:hypothetical protein n=1 Tax=Alphaproteobacteria TaxID=28211 RepID=UPI00326438FD